MGNKGIRYTLTPHVNSTLKCNTQVFVSTEVDSSINVSICNAQKH